MDLQPDIAPDMAAPTVPEPKQNARLVFRPKLGPEMTRSKDLGGLEDEGWLLKRYEELRPIEVAVVGDYRP